MSNRNPKQATIKQVIRCAIYTRKSTEEGLQQEFNTLDAQRESGEAYIAAQKHEGWVCIPEKYDDGGFSPSSLLMLLRPHARFFATHNLKLPAAREASK